MKLFTRKSFGLAAILLLVLMLALATSGAGVTTFTGLRVNDINTTGSGLYVTRNLAAASSNAPVAYIKQDSATDDQSVLALVQDAAAAPALDITGAIGIVHYYDAAAYWTATMADGGGLTIDVTSDGTASLSISDTVHIGGGYGFTGTDISTTGNIETNGSLTVDGATALNGGISADSTAFTVANTTGVTKVQGNPVVLSKRQRVVAADVNTGVTILPAVAGASYRLVDCVAIAYGGNAATTTTVDILGTQSAAGVKLVAYAQASLTRSTVLKAGGTGATVLADGASYVACDANTAITIGKTGGALETATGIDVIISYVLE